MTPQEHAQQTFKEGKWHDECPHLKMSDRIEWMNVFLALVEGWADNKPWFMAYGEKVPKTGKRYKRSGVPEYHKLCVWEKLDMLRAWAEEQAEQDVSIIFGENK